MHQFQENSTIRRLEIDRIEWLLRWVAPPRCARSGSLRRMPNLTILPPAHRSGEKKLKTLQLPGFKGVGSRQV
jgi:hypothetical protein